MGKHSIYGTQTKSGYLFCKRVLDIVLSMAALLIIAPVMLVIAFRIKVEDGGPIFYKQRRLTKNGRIFWLFKFRSMRPDAEKDGIARLSSGITDERVTPVGKTIRATHLDELPQFFNIIRGDMSLVGPRPERPEIAEKYEQELPEFRLRLQVKAGLTGYAQIYGEYDTRPYDKLQMDMMYIADQSVKEDLRILLMTAKMFFRSIWEKICHKDTNPVHITSEPKIQKKGNRPQTKM